MKKAPRVPEPTMAKVEDIFYGRHLLLETRGSRSGDEVK